jgi:hypothetical protein
MRDVHLCFSLFGCSVHECYTYIEVVEDWFGNPVSLLIAHSPEEREEETDGVCVCVCVCVCVWERERERERERGDSRKRCSFKGRVEFQFSLFARKSSCICALFQPLLFVLWFQGTGGIAEKASKDICPGPLCVVPRPFLVWRTRHCSLFAFCVEDERTKLRRVTLSSWKSEFTYSVYCRSILSGVGIVNAQLVGGLEVILR